MTRPSQPAAAPLAPYRGIEPFRYVDRQIFFVREEETQQLVRQVTLYRGVLLYGDSGTGKSSLVNAGLIPAALAEGFTPDHLRVQPRPGEEIVVERLPAVAESRPPYLASNFAGDDDPAPRTVLSVKAFRNTLTYLREVRPESRPLLIFDQFEEFVTLFEEAPSGAAVREAAEAQQAILDMLVALLRDRELPVKVLLVFREDYLAKLSKIFALCPNLPDHHLRLLPPHVAALPQIIRGPFEAFPGHFQQELSPELASLVAAAVAARSELGKVNLSEVQIACLRLWQSKNPDALFAKRGIGGLLEDYLGAALYRLEARLRDPATALLARMVTASGTRNVISAEDLISLVHNEGGAPEELLTEALADLESRTKLVRRERRHETYFYEIVSEFLIPWISRQREERTRERMAEAERRKKVRAYAVAAAMTAFALAVVVIAWVIVRKNAEASLKEQELSKTRQELQSARGERDAALRLLNQARAEKDELTKRLEASRRELEASQAAELILLRYHADAEKDVARLTDLLKGAGAPEGAALALPTPFRQHRQEITIQYEQDWPGAPKAVECWTKLGFRTQGSPGRVPPINLICGAEVGGEYVRMAALCLITAGVHSFDIRPATERQPKVIRVTSALAESVGRQTDFISLKYSWEGRNVCGGR